MDLTIFPKYISMHCPRKVAVQSAGGAPKAGVGPSPGPPTTAVGPCRARAVASRGQCGAIWFTSLCPPLALQDLPPCGGHESLCTSMLATKTVFSTSSAAPFAVTCYPVVMYRNEVRNIHTSTALSISCHCCQFSKDVAGQLYLKTDANAFPTFGGWLNWVTSGNVYKQESW